MQSFVLLDPRIFICMVTMVWDSLVMEDSCPWPFPQVPAEPSCSPAHNMTVDEDKLLLVPSFGV